MTGSTEYQTPREQWEPLHQEFKFNVDAASTDANALVRPCQWYVHDCPIETHPYPLGRYYTPSTDGTRREHYKAGDRVWCNPPFSPHELTAAFIETAAWTARNVGALWVMVLDAKIQSTHVYHNVIWDRHLHRPRERIEKREPEKRWPFIRPDGKRTAPPGPVIVVVFYPPLEVLS